MTAVVLLYLWERLGEGEPRRGSKSSSSACLSVEAVCGFLLTPAFSAPAPPFIGSQPASC